jgi:hypothetical protein
VLTTKIVVEVFRTEGLAPIPAGVGGAARTRLATEAEQRVVTLIRESGREAERAHVSVRAEIGGKVVRTSLDAYVREAGGTTAIEVKRVKSFLEGLGMTERQMKVYPKLVEGLAEGFGRKAVESNLTGQVARPLELYLVKKGLIWRVRVTL